MGSAALKIERYGGWIQTYTGKRFYPFDPRPEEIDIEDIAHALGNQCRYTGHTRRFYSIGQHSVLVADHLPKMWRKWGLLHDAAEAYICDVARPVKYMLEMQAYRDTGHRIMEVIASKFRLSWPKPDIVKIVDNRILATEARDLMPSIEGWVLPEPPIADLRIVPWTPAESERQFLMAWQDLESDPIAHFNVTGRK